ncbi:MAG: histidine kinase [Bacteroidota bacterium]|nr:histidine kinase [Bacteroidota bacterium]
MNLLKPRTQFPILNLVWAPLLALLVNHYFFWEDYFSTFLFWATATAITLPAMFLLSQAQIGLSLYLRKRYARFDQRKTRFLAWIFVSLPMTLLVIVALWMLYNRLSPFADRMPAASLQWALLMGAVTHIIAIIINEGQFTYHQWKVAIIEAERLQKINWENRYEGLKQQVNPHFLFNSINTLSSLIHEDKQSAGQYVREMSQVYRYLLRNNDDELVPLATELKFIYSYYHLLKTRFGTAIHLRIDVPEHFMPFLLPPLTLQMLVENAVKHNNVSKDSPLQIRICCTKEGWLQVENNLQKRLGNVESTGIGLSNIREKYRLLGLPDVQLLNNGETFTAVIPLIEQLVQRRLK